jgi:serine protease DegS
LLGGAMGAPFRQRVVENLGSGVILDRQGHIVTNHHVIERSAQINVQLADGRTAAARVVGRDPDTDIAVLKVDLEDLPVMKQGRADRIAVGDVVLAIGNSFGLSQTVTQGIISATGRADLGVALYEDFIQTDAAINIGNSGGALVNVRGELIGINTAVLGSGEGIGIAIPVDLVRGVLAEILQHGRVIRGWIGIVPEDVTVAQLPAMGLPHAGVFVNNLYRDSPAHRGGIAPGDMIEAIDGQPVASARETLARIASRKPDSRVQVTVQRGQQEFTVELPVVAAPQRREP